MGTTAMAHLPGDDPTTVDPANCRFVRLRTPKLFGSDNVLDAELIRPLVWLQENSVIVGRSIHFSIPELGIDGPAEVVAVAERQKTNLFGRVNPPSDRIPIDRTASLFSSAFRGRTARPPHRSALPSRQTLLARSRHLFICTSVRSLLQELGWKSPCLTLPSRHKSLMQQRVAQEIALTPISAGGKPTDIFRQTGGQGEVSYR